jgi:hypothetical protein
MGSGGIGNSSWCHRIFLFQQTLQYKAMDGKLSSAEAALIIEHNDVLISGQQMYLRDLEDIFPANRSNAMRGQIAYLRHSIQALRWSSSIAVQRIRPEEKHGN